MAPSELLLRCYGKRSNGQYVAVCIDLSLAAQSDTMEDAIIKLESMIHTYIEEALTIHKEYAPQLLKRKAPISQVIEYNLIKGLASISSMREKLNGRRIIDEVFPLKPA